MSRQKYAVLGILPFVLLGLSACAETSSKYRDISELEKPPQMDVVKSTAEATETTSDTDTKPDTEAKNGLKKHTAKGLGDTVSLVDASHLIINKPFTESWALVEKALKLSGMEITDRNREKGQYYVVFDPDTAEQKNGEKPGFLTVFLTDNGYPKGRYLLTFFENPRSVKINIQFLEYLSTETETESTLPDNGVEKLLKKLYTTLHDDLSVD